MNRMMKMALRYAESFVDNPTELVWALLDELAAKFGYSVEVEWSGDIQNRKA